MITIITMNPSIDISYFIDDLEIGQVHRCLKYYKTPGGKGINVAKVCNEIGEKVSCIGFLGGVNGNIINNQLKHKKINTNFVKINDNTRQCINIITAKGISTEILESGPTITVRDREKFENVLEAELIKSDILVASGSLPKGLPENYYRNIGEKCKEYNVKFILDTSGKFLEYGLNSKPFFIKPNKKELEQLLKIKINSIEEVINGANIVKSMGAKNVAVSLGEEGMIFVGDLGNYLVKIPKINITNTVGCGDAVVAGLAVGIENKYPIEDILKLANSCGISNAMYLETGKVDYNMVNKIKKEIDIIRL
ncbi:MULTISPECIES: 1-phosphofructokinase [Clostridium]|uniref:Tagatose-6-phosphate kinase n=1 Tax=Clostridium senegalense TaxID=1465809 RepID=A0A6M0H5I2_9CLOT|nr:MULTISPECIES: 1-phosphofructokinase [Clostridium]NEU05975.1 1-phosphofructokinase [Clostridium senegalense]